MADEKAQKLLQGGIAAAKKGDTELAKRAFSQVLKLESNNEAAWLGLATVTEETDAKIRILNKILTINPDNERAREALRRLGIGDEDEVKESVLGVTPKTEEETTDNDTIPDPPASVWGVGAEDDSEPEADPWGLSQQEDEDEEEDIGLPPLEVLPSSTNAPSLTDEAPKPISRIRRLGEPVPDPDATFDFEPSAPVASSEAKPTTEDGRRIFVVKKSADVFASAPNALGGLNGIPIPPQGIVDNISAEAKASVQEYLERSLEEYVGYEFEKKKRQRAGQNEWTQFLFVSGLTTLIMVGLLAGGFGYLILTNDTAVKILFAPTWTPSVTPTASHTPTPGVTNTPSPTPRNTSTPVPTLRPTITPGNPVVNFPPRPTDFYEGNYTVDDIVVNQAVNLLARDDLNAAFSFLQTERENAINSGDFLPTYFLVDLFVRQNQFEEARNAIAEYQENVQERNQESYRSLINISRAKINIAEAEQIGSGELLQEAEDLLEDVIRLPDEDVTIPKLDPNNPEAYLLMSEVYRLQNRNDDAVELLDDIINTRDPARQELYANQKLRLGFADLYRALGRNDDALVIYDQILTINPFNEDALLGQIEIAFEDGDTGLAVLFSEEYLYYYPGSVEGYLALGRARRAENKLDLALNAFTRGLGGDERDPVYAEILRERAAVYRLLGRNSEAESDIQLASDLGGETPQAIYLSVQSALASGSYSLDQLQDDIEQLRGTGVTSNSELSFLLGQAQIESEAYRDAAQTLNLAINQGLRPADRPQANEWIALAEFELGNLDEALTAIDEALDDGDTVLRRYLRAQIREGLASDDEARLAALNDYEFALLWGSLYGVDYLDDIEEAYNDLAVRIGRGTS